MKFNKENSKEQMVYVAPKTKVFTVRPQNVICGSIEGDEINWFSEDGDELNC